MRRDSRRQFLQCSLALVGISLLSGCEKTPSPSKVPRIGFLAVGSREGRGFLIEGFLQGLRELGYVEGQNIVIEYRFSEDRDDRLPELAAQLVDLKVKLILASGTPASFAAKQATSTIPIVMGGLAANPVETGLVASLARPGGNITGMTLMTSQLGGKRLDLLKVIVPDLAQVAVFWNSSNPTYGPVLKELEAAAPALGLKLQRLEVRVPGDLEGAFKTATRQRVGALIAPGDPLVANRPKVVADLAPKEVEVQDRHGAWYSLRIRPYRTEDRKIDGAVMVLYDVDQLKRGLEEVREARDTVQAIVETVPGALVVLDADLHVMIANRAFYETLQLERQDHAGAKLSEVVLGKWNPALLNENLRKALARNKTFDNLEIEGVFERLGHRIFSFEGRSIDLGGDDRKILLVSMTDVTKRKNADAEMLTQHSRPRRTRSTLFIRHRSKITIR